AKIFHASAENLFCEQNRVTPGSCPRRKWRGRCQHSVICPDRRDRCSSAARLHLRRRLCLALLDRVHDESLWRMADKVEGIARDESNFVIRRGRHDADVGRFYYFGGFYQV